MGHKYDQRPQMDAINDGTLEDRRPQYSNIKMSQRDRDTTVPWTAIARSLPPAGVVSSNLALPLSATFLSVSREMTQLSLALVARS